MEAVQQARRKETVRSVTSGVGDGDFVTQVLRQTNTMQSDKDALYGKASNFEPLPNAWLRRLVFRKNGFSIEEGQLLCHEPKRCWCSLGGIFGKSNKKWPQSQR